MRAGFRSSAAVPLKYNGALFGVLQFFSNLPGAFNADTLIKLEAAAERVAPMIQSSLLYERSLSSALTDPVTELPNQPRTSASCSKIKLPSRSETAVTVR